MSFCRRGGIDSIANSNREEVIKLDNRKVDDGISELVGALFDPIIVGPSPWMDTLPEWIKGEIKLQRLVQLMIARNDESQRGMATDAEALAYMYPLSLERPLDHDWTEIYLYLGTRVMESNMSGRNREFPQDIRKVSLTDDQMRDLNHLKRWIYDQRIKARRERDKSERRQRREDEVAERKALKPSLFEL